MTERGPAVPAVNRAGLLTMNRSRAQLFVITALLLCLGPACRRATTPQNDSRRAPLINDQSRITGRVIRIADGDTLTLLDTANVQSRIRLQGIDAPESHQAYGAQSKQNLSQLVFGKDVTATCDKTDQYGRQICKILLNDRDINLEQIKAGLAWHYKEYEREQSPQDREAYARAEDEARQARRGLWADANPVEPSEYRREERKEREAR